LAVGRDWQFLAESRPSHYIKIKDSYPQTIALAVDHERTVKRCNIYP